jgi:alcohol dehydrogenase
MKAIVYEVLGSHGMQAYRYSELLAMIRQGVVHPERLIGDRISLEEAPGALTTMDKFNRTGVTVIDRF